MNETCSDAGKQGSGQDNGVMAMTVMRVDIICAAYLHILQ